MPGSAEICIKKAQFYQGRGGDADILISQKADGCRGDWIAVWSISSPE
jgi:hypothetical protein